ncbi:cytoplasmic protein [endosymbiont 'TC1' of Trimyema compressum]|uniref:DUF4180 domain-containing protein n=1 Tax=endosymbiont 'TC1' of Trimyema compressum TaxID=243899 RepID=UPI0007F060DE|nr:DUF4180 domain-containing protein [endosymbiont 'TC1' of Trimyema compressum]AMP21232.1 cytoplasmic protein [endosymbiont 'TC1' of Trimyema compressum]
MTITTDIRGNSKVAIVNDLNVIIENVQEALDLMATVNYQYGCHKILIHKEALTEEFFDLKTGLAGEILQKYTNYGIKIAIIGDFSIYNNKSLKDFMYESNKGNNVFFLENEDKALETLHSK